MYTDTTRIDIEAHINSSTLSETRPLNSLLLMLDQSGLFIVSESRSSGVQRRIERPVGVTSGSTQVHSKLAQRDRRLPTFGK